MKKPLRRGRGRAGQRALVLRPTDDLLCGRPSPSGGWWGDARLAHVPSVVLLADLCLGTFELAIFALTLVSAPRLAFHKPDEVKEELGGGPEAVCDGGVCEMTTSV